MESSWLISIDRGLKNTDLFPHDFFIVGFENLQSGYLHFHHITLNKYRNIIQSH